jgi:electron transport complex protein RnfD
MSTPGGARGGGGRIGGGDRPGGGDRSGGGDRPGGGGRIGGDGRGEYGEHLVVQPAPFLKRALTTPVLMRDVLLALVPVTAAAVWHFGMAAVLVVLAAVVGAMATESVLGREGRAGLLDGSAALTGVLLGLTLPPGIPLWMAFLGGVVAIGLGKAIWGGLGHNLFNPALVGRAFLQAAFPTTLTTWMAPAGGRELASVPATSLAPPFLHVSVDAVSAATPLALAKFRGEGTAIDLLLGGNTPGSLGETSAGLLLLVGIVLAVRRTFDWRIPVAVLASVAAFQGVLHQIDPAKFQAATFALCSGGLLFGTVFMATDPVTSPMAPRGAWVFGAGVGFLVVLIRTWGGLPEGVMYAILLMNAATPLIERGMQPRAFGRRRTA